DLLYSVTQDTSFLITKSFHLAGVEVSPVSIVGSMTAKGIVGLDAPAPRPVEIELECTNPAASVPSKVTIPAGKKSATFPITTVPVSDATFGRVIATEGSCSTVAGFFVIPISVRSLSFLTPVVGGAKIQGTVTLEYPAAPNDITVHLRSGRP